MSSGKETTDYNTNVGMIIGFVIIVFALAVCLLSQLTRHVKVTIQLLKVGFRRQAAPRRQSVFSVSTNKEEESCV